MVKFLLKRGASKDTTNAIGASPQRVALAQGHATVARMLEY